MFRRSSSAFNLVELISAIAIMAVLVVMSVVVIPNVVGWAQSVSDQKTLLVLNDALTRYKCEGGNVNSLTLGVYIGRVISYLQSTITFAGYGHNVMQQGKTYYARSLLAVGTKAQYHFFQYNTYKAETLAAGTPTSALPYGQGVGYVANSGSRYYSFNITTSTGYWAWATANGTVTGPLASGSKVIPTGNTSVTFWSCSSSSTNASGTVSVFACSGSALTSLDVTGLTSLTSLNCVSNSLTSLDVSRNTALTSLDCSCNSLTSLDVSKNTALTYLACVGDSLTSLDASKNTALTELQCYSNSITSLDVSKDTALATLYCEYNSLTSLDVSNNPVLTILYCFDNNLGPIYLGGHLPTTLSYIQQNTGYTPTLN